MISRRSMLALAGAGSVLGATGAVLNSASPARGAGEHGGHAPMAGAHEMPMTRPADAGQHPQLEKFSLPMPILGTARPRLRTRRGDVYYCPVRSVGAEVYPGLPTTVYSYFGTWTPQVIRARQGRPVLILQSNRTEAPISTHLHGGVTRAMFDGQMSNAVPPRSSMTYLYDNDQPAAALWMHDHVHMAESEHVYRGMAAPYIIGSDEEDALGLPSGEFEIPLMLRDGDFGADGSLVYTLDDTANRSTIMVNGTPWPLLKVKARKYRFRVLNASNMRFFVLGLSNGAPFTQIGSDCGLLPAPTPAPVLVLSPGERADLVIDFSEYAAGTRLELLNYIGPGPMEDVGKVMAFEVGEVVEDSSRVPDQLSVVPEAPPASMVRTFDLFSSEPGVTPMVATINGQAFDMNRIDTEITHGATEEWVVTNRTATIPHNFHMHLAHFRVVGRSERPVGPDEAGFKDTVAVFPGQTVRLRMTFDTHRGTYPYHCHMIDHSAMGMMAQMRIR